MKADQKIRVRLFGGLGNQLFQYFAGLHVAAKFDLQLELDNRWITKSQFHSNSDIQDFKFLNYVDMVTLENSGNINFFFERLKTKFAQKSNLLANSFNIDAPRNPNFQEISLTSNSLELRGYYQTYLYFQDVCARMGKIDWKLNFESENFLEIRNALETEPFIAIHVRGGDYLTASSLYHRLDARYFEKALFSLRNEIGSFRAFVFTDDYGYAKELLKTIPGLIFIDQKGLRASEAMILISMAKGIVISNSTFSYWAAIINASSSVRAPMYWFFNRSVDGTLYPSSWKLIL